MILLQLMELAESVPGKGPQLVAVVRSERRDLLEALLQAETVPSYPDELPDGTTVRKMYRRGGPLEMYLPPADESQMIVDIGSKEERLQAMIQEMTERLNVEWEAVVANTIPCDDGLQLLNLIKPN